MGQGKEGGRERGCRPEHNWLQEALSTMPAKIGWKLTKYGWGCTEISGGGTCTVCIVTLKLQVGQFCLGQ